MAARTSEAVGTPVVFIHGLWLHADSWGVWVDRFRDFGYAPITVGWPGDSASVEETRRNAERVAGYGLDEIVRNHIAAIADLDTKPIVVGHSFGGLIAQRLLADGYAIAGVAIDPAPIKGVYVLPPSELRVASVALRNPLNRGRAVALSRKQFRYGFGNQLTQAESDELFDRWAIPSPGKPLFEAAFANLSRHSPARVDTEVDRGPLLLTAGLKDHTVPPSTVRATSKRYRHSPAVTDYIEFPGRGHTLALDTGWPDVAESVLAWLKDRSL
jgi:pimeloyl-ACP methyl ester carboxylesterase